MHRPAGAGPAAAVNITGSDGSSRLCTRTAGTGTAAATAAASATVAAALPLTQPQDARSIGHHDSIHVLVRPVPHHGGLHSGSRATVEQCRLTSAETAECRLTPAETAECRLTPWRPAQRWTHSGSRQQSAGSDWLRDSSAGSHRLRQHSAVQAHGSWDIHFSTAATAHCNCAKRGKQRAEVAPNEHPPSRRGRWRRSTFRGGGGTACGSSCRPSPRWGLHIGRQGGERQTGFNGACMGGER